MSSTSRDGSAATICEFAVEVVSVPVQVGDDQLLMQWNNLCEKFGDSFTEHRSLGFDDKRKLWIQPGGSAFAAGAVGREERCR